MGMALLHAGVGDADELGVVQVLDGCGSAVAHAASESADELIDDFLDGALVGDSPGNAFGHELLGVLDVSLEVAVLRAALHGFEGAHAAVALELTSVVDDGVAWAFFRSGHQRAYHDAVAAGCEGFHHIAAVAQTSVGYEGNACPLQGTGYVIDGTELWHADACYDAGGADAARPDADLHAVGSCLYEHTGGIAGGDVAHYDIYIGEHLLGFAQLFDDELAVAVCRIDDDGIDVGLYECTNAIHRVGCDAHSGGYAQAALAVLTGHGLVLGLRDVLVGYQANEFVVIVQDGKFLYLVLLQYLCCCAEVGLQVRRDEVLARHHLVDGAVDVLLETEVAIGDDAFQVALVIDHGNAADVVFRHQFEGIADAAAQFDGDWVVDHAVLGTLHDGHLAGLLLDAHVLVYDSDASFAGNGYCHGCFGNGVHRCRHEGNLQFDVAREKRLERYRAGKNLGIGGN